MSMPLKGIRVLDLSRVIAGPFCSQILADFGAEVIKIEDTRGGDPSRWQPPLLGDTGSLFYFVNRNKKSLALDLKQEGDCELFKQLAAGSDVLLEQFRPGVMGRLGLGYSALNQLNPRLVYCSLSGYGQTGPMAMKPGHDLNFQSLTGMAALNGKKDEDPVAPPLTMAALAGGSLHAALAILLALFHREKTGQGQYCDVSILDGAMSLMVQALADRAGWNRPLQRGQELLSGGFACYNIYPTRDGRHVSLAAVEAPFWQAFCAKIERPDYVAWQWVPNQQEEMITTLREIFAQRDRDEWMELLADSELCFSPTLDLDEACRHPQILARDMVHVLEDFQGSGRSLNLTGIPIKLSASPGQFKPVFPTLGQHNQEILEALKNRAGK